jgi:hypothetical protein
VIDLPTSMSYVNAKSVADWGVGEDEVFAAIAQRLDDLASVEVSLYDRDQGPLWHVTSNDSYETSRLLVPGWLASFAGKVEGRPIAIMPERATIMIAGDARPEMITRLLAKADREYRASNRRISPALYTIDDDGVVIPFRRPDGAPLASELAIAHEKLALEEYDIQKNALDQLDEDVFVATYTAYVREGRPLSRAVWTVDVPTHLPKTDVVVLLVPGAGEDDEPREVIEAPWDAVAHRLKPVPGLHPPRFATLDFPDESERRRLTRVSG